MKDHAKGVRVVLKKWLVDRELGTQALKMALEEGHNAHIFNNLRNFTQTVPLNRFFAAFFAREQSTPRLLTRIAHYIRNFGLFANFLGICLMSMQVGRWGIGSCFRRGRWMEWRAKNIAL